MIKRIHFSQDGHRLNLDTVPLMTRTLDAGIRGGREIKFVEQRHGVAIYRENAPKSGKFEKVHTIPWAGIMQTDEEGEVRSTDEFESSPKVNAVTELLGQKKSK